MAAGLSTQAERLASGEEARGALDHAVRRRRVLVLLGAYAVVAGGSASLALTLGRDPLAGDAWLGTSGSAAVLLSLGGGICIGAATVAATRVVVKRAAWARALHAALRPAVHGADDGWLLAIAVASAAAEELLFRGLLVPVVGVVLSSLAFGVLHQIRGQARWGWMAWATVMGLLFGTLFAATGSLAGPVAAHAIVNAANLRFLRDNDPSPRPRPLGGLLRRG
jgi:membrane protease YdiL (CAAX protease family)